VSSVVRCLAGCRLLAARRARRRPGSPAELAKRFDPKFVITPAIALLSDLAVAAVEGEGRDIVTCPPRTGKSRLLAVATPVWALMRDPDATVMLISYSDELAQEHSREARRLIAEHAEFLGFSIAADKSSVGRWAVAWRAAGRWNPKRGHGFRCVGAADHRRSGEGRAGGRLGGAPPPGGQ
jgi:hypothetical protein